MSDPTDDLQARAAALADAYADPFLKLARYQVLTDDLLARLDEAVNHLQRVVQAGRDDTKMGYPIPGDSCLAACIGLEVMRFLDEIGALTERSVADAMSSTSGGIPAQVGTGRSVSAPDIDALASTVLEALRCSTLGDWSLNAVATEDLSSLVAIAKEAVRDNDDLGAVVVQMEERAERAERDRDDARRSADDITYTKGHVAFLRDRVEAREARVAELKKAVERELRVLERWAGEQNAGNAFAEQVLYQAQVWLAAVADLDTKEGAA